MVNAAAEVAAVPPDGVEDVHQGGDQIEDAARAAVRQRLLGELPDSFIGIQFGSVARKSDQVKTMNTGEQAANQSTLVRPATVPEDEHVASQVTEKVA